MGDCRWAGIRRGIPEIRPADRGNPGGDRGWNVELTVDGGSWTLALARTTWGFFYPQIAQIFSDEPGLGSLE